jgi:hypothetical protein
LRVCLLQKLAGTCQPVDKIITEKISDFMEEGVSKVSEMKRHIKAFSRNQLELTDEDNRRFFPHDKDIRNRMESIKRQTWYHLVFSYIL